MINFLEPSLNSIELSNLSEVFDSKWIGKGQKVDELESRFAELFNVPSEHIVSITSCTEAIFMAMEIFEIEFYNQIIVPSISFIAVPAAVKKFGSLALCDIDRDTLQITAQHIEDRIGFNTRAVFLTHYGGFSCEMNDIVSLCKSRGLLLFEDSACSMFTKHDGKSCGVFGDIGMWSLDAMKIITSGDGGIMYFKDKERADRARKMTYLGLTKESGLSESKLSNDRMWWEYDIDFEARRLIMNDISATIGISQLDKSDDLLKKRLSLTRIYDECFKDIENIKVLKDTKSDFVTPYFYTIQTSERNQLAKYLLENDVYTTFKYYPIHRISFFEQDIYQYDEKLEFSNSDYVADNTLNLPLHSNMSAEDAIYICKLILDYGK